MNDGGSFIISIWNLGKLVIKLLRNSTTQTQILETGKSRLVHTIRIAEDIPANGDWFFTQLEAPLFPTNVKRQGSDFVPSAMLISIDR